MPLGNPNLSLNSSDLVTLYQPVSYVSEMTHVENNRNNTEKMKKLYKYFLEPHPNFYSVVSGLADGICFRSCEMWNTFHRYVFICAFIDKAFFFSMCMMSWWICKSCFFHLKIQKDIYFCATNWYLSIWWFVDHLINAKFRTLHYS